MSDLISRQTAIEGLKKTLLFRLNPELAERVRHYLESVPAADGWIPCEKALPFAEYGESDNVFATCRKRYYNYVFVKILYFNGGVWCWPTGETFEDEAIAWMPLPEPYKEEK